MSLGRSRVAEQLIYCAPVSKTVTTSVADRTYPPETQFQDATEQGLDTDKGRVTAERSL